MPAATISANTTSIRRAVFIPKTLARAYAP